jgi:hypothetical protein
VTTPEGPGRVVGHDVPRDEVKVRLDDGGRCACSRADVCGSRKAYDAAYPTGSGLASGTGAGPGATVEPFPPAEPAPADVRVLLDGEGDEVGVGPAADRTTQPSPGEAGQPGQTAPGRPRRVRRRSGGTPGIPGFPGNPGSPRDQD